MKYQRMNNMCLYQDIQIIFNVNRLLIIQAKKIKKKNSEVYANTPLRKQIVAFMKPGKKYSVMDIQKEFNGKSIGYIRKLVKIMRELGDIKQIRGEQSSERKWYFLYVLNED